MIICDEYDICILMYNFCYMQYVICNLYALKKNIVNFNEYLVEYWQLNIY